MLKRAAAVAALLGFVGSALGQMTLIADERYTDCLVWGIDDLAYDTDDVHESAAIGQPFVSSILSSPLFGVWLHSADASQNSSVTGDLISADLTAFAHSLAPAETSSGSSIARSRLNVVFSLSEPTPYDFTVTTWFEDAFLPFIGQATARLEWADGSGVIEDLVGVSSASGVLAAGEYRLILNAHASVSAGQPNIEALIGAGVSATFSVPATPSACSEADVTTQGAGAGDPLFGIPDGIISGADINFFVNEWVTGCP